VEEIRTSKGAILQTSSKISGKLEEGWEKNVGTIITSMLPAGSVTGAPKKKTVEIIKEVENYERGFYTGIAGIFDGTNLSSCVLIRFIEQTDSGLYFKTGGGITSKSDCTKEYQEMLEKIYVPTI
jgi:para-aminobenzoate synthetase component 1